MVRLLDSPPRDADVHTHGWLGWPQHAMAEIDDERLLNTAEALVQVNQSLTTAAPGPPHVQVRIVSTPAGGLYAMAWRCSLAHMHTLRNAAQAGPP